MLKFIEIQKIFRDNNWDLNKYLSQEYGDNVDVSSPKAFKKTVRLLARGINEEIKSNLWLQTLLREELGELPEDYQHELLNINVDNFKYLINPSKKSQQRYIRFWKLCKKSNSDFNYNFDEANIPLALLSEEKIKKLQNEALIKEIIK